MFDAKDAVIIRRATADDSESVAELWFKLSQHHSVYHEYYAVKEEGLQHLLGHVSELLKRGCILFVAEKNGEICGFVSGFIISRNPQLSVEVVGKVDNIYVDESARGMGIGTGLLGNLFEYFKNNNVNFYEISCDIQNPDALRLYKKLGFVEQKVMLVKSNLPTKE
jgi:ribosomal protein S18 acetylase RimI-like enzyme